MGFIPLAEGEIKINDLLLCPETINTIRQQLSFLPQELNLDLASARDLLLYPFEFKNNRHLLPNQKAVSEMLDRLLLSDQLLQKTIRDIRRTETKTCAGINYFIRQTCYDFGRAYLCAR